MSLQIIETKDGSHSVFNAALNETYHSIHGAVQESRHVFIHHGLVSIQASFPDTTINVLEVGFGTGLNALLACEYAEKNHVHVRYHTLETFRLSLELVEKLNYPALLEWLPAEKFFHKIHFTEWDKEQSITDHFDIKKIQGSVHDIELPTIWHCIFFDAFAPEKQPDMWHPTVLKKVANALQPRGTFVTYCAMGQLRRDLAALNLKVEKLPGPPGKREMTRATKMN